MQRYFLLLVFFLVNVRSEAAEKPNFLWITCEDISAHIGCYGDPYAKTPRIDELAANGTRFTHAFMSAGVCAPCRSSIITGMYQNSVGTHHMRCNATLPEWLRPFPNYFRKADYYCTNNSKTDYQFSNPHPREIWDHSGSKAHWKGRKTDQPFFAVFNYTGCHESGIADESKYEKVTADLTEKERQDPAAFENLPPYYPDTPVVREDWKRNYELITAMDHWAGGLIDELKEAGEWENTIVIFWSDHGIGLPRAKRWLYDSGTHVPFIAHVPEKFSDRTDFASGSVDDRLINSVDFAPTMLELAGMEIPDYMQGRSFATLSQPREYVYGARDRMDERYDIIRAVRDKRYRYIRNFEPLKPYYQYMNTPEKGATMKEIRAAEKSGSLPETVAQYSRGHKPVHELYDLENDPHEINNLAEQPEHAERLSTMQKALTDWQLAIGDIGLIPESEITARVSAAGSHYAILHGEEDQSGFIAELTAMATQASTPLSLPALLTGLNHHDATVRYWGATGLGNFAKEAGEAEEVQTALEEALSDTSPAVRIAAARALCRMGVTVKGLPVLETELEGENEWARLEAAIVLDELDEAARPALAALESALVDQPNKYIVRVANKAVNDLKGTSNKVP